MSSFIKFELKQLKQLINDKKSLVIEKSVAQNISLQPWCVKNLKESVKQFFDYKIGKFDEGLNGIILSYKNLRVVQNARAMRDGNLDLNFQVKADYFVFQPQVGAVFKGIVTKKSLTHLEVLLYGVFNIIIPRPTEKLEKEWIGMDIQENQEVTFKIVVLDLYGALPYIRGELDSRRIHVGQGGDEEALELSNTKTIESSYDDRIYDKTNLKPQNSDKSIQPNRNYMTSYKQSTKNNAIINYKSNEIHNHNTGNEVDVRPKNRRKNHQ